MTRTQTLKPVMDPTGNHQVGVQLAVFADDVPLAKVEVPTTIAGALSIEALFMLYTNIKPLLPPELR
jgi:hypothetical protein